MPFMANCFHKHKHTRRLLFVIQCFTKHQLVVTTTERIREDGNGLQIDIRIFSSGLTSR